MASSRFALGVALAFALATAIAALDRARARTAEGCATPTRLSLESLTGPRDEALFARQRPGSRMTDAFAGTIPHPLADDAVLRVRSVRSYSPSELYENPLRLLDLKLDPEDYVIQQVDVGSRSVPVHVVRDRTRSPHHVVAYLFVYRGEPVAGPLWAHLASLPALVLDGVEPMTLFISDGPTGLARAGDPVEQRAVEWVVSAWRRYEAACR
jgi:hypothetical protein